MMADAAGRDRPVTGVEREAAGVFDENARLRGPDPRHGDDGTGGRNIPSLRPAWPSRGPRPAMHHAPLRTHSLRTQREPERAEETAS